jgi:hypothetical protein
VGWWDASDAATLFAADTGTTLATTTVGRWANKGTLGSAADLLQANSSARPAINVATRNGTRVLSFDGVNDAMQRSFTLAQPCTLLMVFSYSAPFTAATTLMDGAGTGNTLRLAPTGPNSATFTTGGGNGLQLNMGAWGAFNAWQQASFVANSGTSSVYRDGPLTSGGTGTTSAVTNPNGLTLAMWGSGGTQWAGVQIAEVVAFNTALSTTDRARVEAYLAAKWGITGVHRAVPDELKAVAAPTEIGGCAGWWDGSRTDKMFDAASGGNPVANGGTVRRLEDLSGNGKHLTQDNTSVAPLRLDGGQSGRTVLSCGGSRAMSAGTASDWNFLHNSQGGTVFAVVKPFATPDPNNFASLVRTNLNSTAQVGVSVLLDDRSLYPRNNYAGVSVTAGVSGQSVATVERNNLYDAADQFQLFSIRLDCGQATAASRAALFLSGVAGGTTTGAIAASSSNAAEPLLIGAAVFNSLEAIAEVIVFNTPLSPTDRARVEKYLAQKWGIANVPDPTPPVGYWRDKSGNNRHATQATGASRPTVGSVGSRPALVFDAANDGLSLASGISLGTGGYSVSAVLRHQGGFQVFLEGGSLSPYMSSDPSAAAGLYHYDGLVGVSAVGAMPASTNTIASFSIAPADRSIYAQGARVAVGVGTSRSATIQNIGRTGSGFWWSGRIAELILHTRQISASERQRIERYLAAKWGITLAPQVSNADAQDWVNRVYQNGGTVSSTTATAVNTFCNAIDEAGIRDRFYRLNLFCGTGLSACLVPLYRGPSFGGTQYGGTTDANNGPFVSGDYAETGASGGLTGNGTSKYLDTGLTYDAMGVPSTNHIGVFKGAGTWNTSIEIIGARDADDYYYIQGRAQVGGDHKVHAFSGPGASGGSFINNATVSSATNFLVASRNSSASFVLYQNAASVASTSSAVTIAGSNRPFLVFMRETGTGPSFIGWTHRLLGYSFGLGMSAAQVSAYNSAMQALQTSLSRNV